MKSSTLALILGSALAALGACASAAEPLFKPGLWESSNKAGAGGSQLNGLLAAAQQQLASMDPAQRSRIEGVMARNGVVVENGGVTAKACITPAMAARQQVPMQQRGSCTYRFDPPQGSTISYAFSCSSPVARGEGSAVFSSPTSYSASTRISGGENGEHSMTIESTGRWLGKDCGNIAPAEMPAG